MAVSLSKYSEPSSSEKKQKDYFGIFVLNSREVCVLLITALAKIIIKIHKIKSLIFILNLAMHQNKLMIMSVMIYLLI